MNNDFYFDNENNNLVDNQNNFSTSENPPYTAENRQNPPPFQPNYYGYQQSYQPFYGNQYENTEALQLFYEKKAVKCTANHIGIGLMLFYAFQFVISYILAIFMLNKNATEFISNPAINLEINILLSLLGFGLSALFILKIERCD